ncbi:MAG: flippase-like domain-containing protein [Thermoleophilia bacterium]|nr:flippase-like domain-containing protein [Thermoleophilia bacterium]
MSRAAAAFGRWFKSIAAVGTLVGVGLALYGQRDAIRAFDWQVSWPALLASVALFAVPPFVQAGSFWLILRFLGVPARLDDTLVVWMRSFLLRYAPTGALAFVFRVRERERLGGASRATILTASGYEQLVALAAGAVTCLVGFGLAGAWPPFAAVLVCGGTLAAAVAVRPRFLGHRVQRLLARRGIVVPTLLRGRRLVLVVAVNALGWAATGAAAWTLVAALSARGAPPVAWLVAVYAFAWMLGFLVPLFPGGLGLRDGTLALSLATRVGAGAATALALALRLANTLGELLAIGLTEVVAFGLRVGFGRTGPAHTAVTHSERSDAMDEPSLTDDEIETTLGQDDEFGMADADEDDVDVDADDMDADADDADA